jgi:hypothetical protein
MHLSVLSHIGLISINAGNKGRQLLSKQHREDAWNHKSKIQIATHSNKYESVKYDRLAELCILQREPVYAVVSQEYVGRGRLSHRTR